MISTYALQTLTKKHQTTELNIRREYVQHLFLSHFYRQVESDTILFKGGTALRIVFGSPRFSQDLDFSAPISHVKQIEAAIVETLKDIERMGIKTEIIDAKETSGGYLAELVFTLDSHEVNVLLQLSNRSPKDTKEVITVANDFIPPYTLVLLARKRLIAEKIQALLTRAKPRDFYDLYFLIRANLLTKEEKELLVKAKRQLETSVINFEQELKQFLPRSHWPIIHNFKLSLGQEVDRFL